MAYSFDTLPAYRVRPGTMVIQDGVVFSCVFRDCKSCGVILYHLPDLEQIRLPFTDDCRYGSLYSVKIPKLDPSKWAYRYYRDEETFDDPYARELLRVNIGDKELTLARLYTKPEVNLPAYGGKERPSWADQILYCVHVKGFSASKTAKVSRKARGTFQGVIEKIPYLKELGITGVELMPIYELRPQQASGVVGEPINATREDKERSLRVTMELQRNQLTLLDENGNKEKTPRANYWGFGDGCYFAPKQEFSSQGKPQQEFQKMVDALHENGIRVYLQLFFAQTVSIQTQIETVRFYVTHYQIDGFHIKGNASALESLASDPMLSDTELFYYDFPYAELQKEDAENPAMGKPSTSHLCEYTDSFQQVARRFVKSDNQVLRDFLKAFIAVPEGHGRVHYVTNYEGFTLMDLVSYNGKHNEANGENNRDGENNNLSWNCGFEGPCQKKDIRELRLKQMRNFMTINLLAQGTPLITAGDERCNSQDGNNNVYCQDNETGWINWRSTKDAQAMLDFTKKIIAFRKEHAVLRREEPFKFVDYKAVGYPDISFHGKEAWKADLSDYSHTVGVLFPEAYAQTNPSDHLLYLAFNMHWHNQQLAIPKPPEGFVWKVVMDTSLLEAFPENSLPIENQRLISVRSRSIMILEAAPEPKEEQKAPTAQDLSKKDQDNE